MQTSVPTSITPKLVGMDADISPYQETISRLLSTQQLLYVQITGTTDGAYSITLDGDVEASYTASGNTATEIRDELLTDLQASTKALTAEALSTDGILIENTDEDDADGFTYSVAGPGGPDITIAELVAQQQTVGFGIGVVADPRAATSGQQCRLPRLTGEITAGTFLGITRLDTTRETNAAGTWAGYEDKKAVSIKSVGRIAVRVEDAVAEGGQVFCRFADPTADYGLGSFRSDADTSDAVAVPGARFVRAASAGGIAIVELNPTR